MTEARSKRRILPLIFIVKSFKKPLLIRVLKRDNRSSTCSGDLSSAARSRLIAMAPSNFFAFVKTLISHLLSPKLIKTNVTNGNSLLRLFLRMFSLKNYARRDASACYSNRRLTRSTTRYVRQTCSFFRYTCILRTMTELRKKYYHEVLDIHTRKISRLISRQD